MTWLRSLLTLLVLTLGATALLAQDSRRGIYIIYDLSNSMWGELPDKSRKYEVAREVLANFISGEFPNHDLALRLYGHRSKASCEDSELVVPFGTAENVIGPLTGAVSSRTPRGKTPITLSLIEALKDFGDRPGEIILISDGIETCNADPCALVREWQDRDIAVRVHVVGLGLEDEARAAMQCIADAAGTPYRDANSANDLAESLQQIQETAEAEPEPEAQPEPEPVPQVTEQQPAAEPDTAQEPVSATLIINAADKDGEELRVTGSLDPAGETEAFEVTSGTRNNVVSGPAMLVIGVKTENGTIYQPTTRDIVVSRSRDTIVDVVVARPPSLSTQVLGDIANSGRGVIRGFQDGQQVVSFRSIDRVFLDEGTYEFRIDLGKDNQLIETLEIKSGQHYDLIFNAQKTVKVMFNVFPVGSEEKFRKNAELWQDGERKYVIHTHNGGEILPGTYALRLPDALTPFEMAEIEITRSPEQVFNFQMPVGWVTVKYQNADGTAVEAARVNIYPVNSRRGRQRQSEDRFYLIAGRYRAEGWSHLGEFDPVEFQVTNGEDTEVILRAKPE